jgi:RimJ/RimL family protein N-acetyltransferase
MEWSDIIRAAGFTTPHPNHNGGLEFHHLSVKDTLPLTKAMQKNQKHLDAYLPVFGRHQTKGVLEVQTWIRGMLAEEFPSQHFVFKYKGRLCGFASTLPISADPREVQLRYMVFEGFTGKGIGTRIAHTLELYAFYVWGYHRIFIEMDSANAASMRVAQKLDYTFKGTKEYDKVGTKGTGFWYSYEKERPEGIEDGVIQGASLEDFTER